MSFPEMKAKKVKENLLTPCFKKKKKLTKIKELLDLKEISVFFSNELIVCTE